MFKAFCVLFLASTLLYATDDDTDAVCGISPMRITPRHVEANGFGYTSLEGFFSFQSDLNASFFPFIDLRTHVFNNGRFASNAGVGLRYFKSRVWGVNTYYDFLNTSCKNFNQISLGLESLGEVFDFRFNGYLPVGAKTSPFCGVKFCEFKNHHLILASRRARALKSANAEASMHIKRLSKTALYLSAGPYYLNGGGKSSWGGEARVVLNLFNYIHLESNFSYDSIFRSTIQGEVTLIIPLGKKMRRRKNLSCKKSLILSQRVTQRVPRSDIIPVIKKGIKSPAINPKTGVPYFFWFVNNLSSSKGNFESPFSTLASGENSSKAADIVYVYPGDGTSQGMNEGILLKNDQKLLGAGIRHRLPTTRGPITIPRLAKGNPFITNILGDVVTLAHDNEIAGITVRGVNAKGFSCANVRNPSIHDNYINAFSSFFPSFTELVSLDGASGVVQIANNFFLLDNSTLGGPIFAIKLFEVVPGSRYWIGGNTFDSVPGSAATAIELGDRIGSPLSEDFISIDIVNNTFTNVGSSLAAKAIGGAGFTGSGRINIKHNRFIKTGASAFGTGEIVFIRVRDSGNIVANVTNNLWEKSVTPTASSFEIRNFGTLASTCITLSGNQSDNAPIAYELNNASGATMIVDVKNNIGTLVETGTTPGTCP